MYTSEFTPFLPPIPSIQAVHEPPLLPDLQSVEMLAAHPPEWCEGVDVRFERDVGLGLAALGTKQQVSRR